VPDSPQLLTEEDWLIIHLWGLIPKHVLTVVEASSPHAHNGPLVSGRSRAPMDTSQAFLS